MRVVSSPSRVADDLERLAVLTTSGSLTCDEFEAQNAQILGAPVPSDAGGRIGDGWVKAMPALPVVAAAFAAGSLPLGGAVLPLAMSLAAFASALLVLLDHARLEAAGKGLAFWQLFLGLFLTPIYLSVRPRRLRRGMIYLGLYLAALIIAILVVVCVGHFVALLFGETSVDVEIAGLTLLLENDSREARLPTVSHASVNGAPVIADDITVAPRSQVEIGFSDVRRAALEKNMPDCMASSTSRTFSAVDRRRRR